MQVKQKIISLYFELKRHKIKIIATAGTVAIT